MYGNVGVGLSGVQHAGSSTFTVGEIGVTLSYYNWLLKFDRTITNELRLFQPEEKISSNSLLIGYSIQPFNTFPAFHLNGKIGIGNVETVRRGKVIGTAPFGVEYELITDKGNSTHIEVDLELRPTQFLGFYLSTFSNINHIRNTYGASVGLIIGYF